MLRFLTTAAVAAFCSIATAQDGAAPAGPTLSIGDKAPQTAMKVVKGKFDGKFEQDKVYVVEFWATWCGPCKTSMPHLTKLQKQYKDKGVTIIGVSDENEDTVNGFIGKGDWPEKTQYTIAIDDNRKTSNNYMRASGQRGIPTAFIVGKTGILEWIGHPMSMDEPLAQIVDGSYDREAAKARIAKEQAFELIMQQAQQKMMTAFQAQDWDELMSVLDGLKEQAPEEMVPQIQMQQFTVMSSMANLPDRADKIANEIIAEQSGDAQMMNALAWAIATDPRIQQPNLEIALKAANMLDTLATVQAEMGDFAAAIKTEEKALGMVEEGEMKMEFEAKIKEWKAEMATTG